MATWAKVTWAMATWAMATEQWLPELLLSKQWLPKLWLTVPYLRCGYLRCCYLCHGYLNCGWPGRLCPLRVSLHPPRSPRVFGWGAGPAAPTAGWTWCSPACGPRGASRRPVWTWTVKWNSGYSGRCVLVIHCVNTVRKTNTSPSPLKTYRNSYSLNFPLSLIFSLHFFTFLSSSKCSVGIRIRSDPIYRLLGSESRSIIKRQIRIRNKYFSTWKLRGIWRFTDLHNYFEYFNI